jgi:hypothetical protein
MYDQPTTIGNRPVNPAKTKKNVCIVGASGKLGQYMVQHALDKGYEVVGVCRERSVGKLERFKDRITVIPGFTNDREVIEKAVAGCDGVLTVLVPWGNQHYATGTAQAVLDFAPPGTRLIFSCGWHITRDGKDVYLQSLKTQEKLARWFGWLTHVIDIDDQVEACRRIFASDTGWTVVRGSDLEEGESQGLPVWSKCKPPTPSTVRWTKSASLSFSPTLKSRSKIPTSANCWSVSLVLTPR